MIRYVLIVMLTACADISVTDVKLELMPDGLSCVTAPLVTVNSITVEGIGATNGTPCLLATRCVAATNSIGVSMVQQALMAASQPLLDVEASALVELRIEGHPQTDCSATRNMCGTAQLSAATGGALNVEMTCDSVLGMDQCDNTQLPACP